MEGGGDEAGSSRLNLWLSAHLWCCLEMVLIILIGVARREGSLLLVSTE